MFALLVPASAMAQTAPALVVDPAPRYAPQLQVPASLQSCDWAARLAERVRSKADGVMVTVGSGDVAGRRLVFRVARLEATDVRSSRQVHAEIHADVETDGRLIGSQDFHLDEDAGSGDSACEVFRDETAGYASDIADWLADAHLPACEAGCAGIHPDEPILIADSIPPADAETMSDDIISECHWPTAMPGLIQAAYNGDEDRRPRAVLQIVPASSLAGGGRRLVLRAESIHAIGGAGFSGPKWLKMSGFLYDGDMLAGSFTLSESTIRGSFAGCKTLQGLSEDAATNIAEWLHAPGMDTEL